MTTRSAVSDAFWEHLGIKPNTSTSVDSAVSHATVALLYKQLPHGLLASVINSALLVWILADVVDVATLTAWLLLMFSVSAVRYALVFARRPHKTSISPSGARISSTQRL